MSKAFINLMEQRTLLVKYRNLMVREQQFGGHGILDPIIVPLNERIALLEVEITGLIREESSSARDIFFWQEYSAPTYRYLVDGVKEEEVSA